MKLFYYTVVSLVFMLIGNYSNFVIDSTIMTHIFVAAFIILFLCAGIMKEIVRSIPEKYLKFECFRATVWVGYDLIDKYFIAVAIAVVIWGVDVIAFPCGLGALSFFILSVSYAIFNILFVKRCLNKFYKAIEERQYDI